MAQSVKINGVTYENVPVVEIPLSDNTGNNAEFWDTSDATTVSGEILSGKTAYIGSGKVFGGMTDNGAVEGEITTKSQRYTIAQGYHNGSGYVEIDSLEQNKIIADNIKAGITMLGVTGKSSVVDTYDADATSGNILSGKTAYVNGAKLTGSLTTVSVSQDSTTKVLTIE